MTPSVTVIVIKLSFISSELYNNIIITYNVLRVPARAVCHMFQSRDTILVFYVTRHALDEFPRDAVDCSTESCAHGEGSFVSHAIVSFLPFQ